MSESPGLSSIKVVGVGGAGIAALNHMIEKGIEGVAFHAIDTDVEGLSASSKGATALLIGETVTCGRATGGDLDAGRRAAEESHDRIWDLLHNGELVFLTAGIGGGTGSGAAPVIARIAKQELRALTVAMVTYPFGFEGPLRGLAAAEGIEALTQTVDTVMVIPNDRFLESSEIPLSVTDVFQIGYAHVHQVVQTLTEMITKPTLLRRDFADVRAIILDSGRGMMTIGRASGEDRALEAARQATRSELLDLSIDGARGILFSVTGDTSMTLSELNEIASIILERIGWDAFLIFGFAIDEDLPEGIELTLIATGLDTTTAAGM